MFFFLENGKWKDNFKISIKDIGPGGGRKEMEFSPFFPRVFFERKERKKIQFRKRKSKKKKVKKAVVVHYPSIIIWLFF